MIPFEETISSFTFLSCLLLCAHQRVRACAIVVVFELVISKLCCTMRYLFLVVRQLSGDLAKRLLRGRDLLLHLLLVPTFSRGSRRSRTRLAMPELALQFVRIEGQLCREYNSNSRTPEMEKLRDPTQEGMPTLSNSSSATSSKNHRAENQY